MRVEILYLMAESELLVTFMLGLSLLLVAISAVHLIQELSLYLELRF